MARNIQSDGKQGPTARTALPSKISFRIEGQIKSSPNKIDAKRPTPRHIIIKMPKIKDRI